MITLYVADTPGAIPSASIKELFERRVRLDKRLSEEFDLTPLEDGGYLHSETHIFWLGFATGIRTAHRFATNRPV